jgi:DNA-directed RNA polymerase specialized sigma24 family protein
LGKSPRRAEDEEDAAQSALHSFFCGTRTGRFPGWRAEENLWPLLFRITQRKAINLRKRQLSQKRGCGRVRGDSVFYHRLDQSDAGGADGFESPAPPHEAIVDTRDQYEYLLDRLNDRVLRLVAKMKMLGYTNAEIAMKLGVVERTVERKLGLIRRQFASAIQS